MNAVEEMFKKFDVNKSNDLEKTEIVAMINQTLA
jgi:hypothetical protein